MMTRPIIRAAGAMMMNCCVLLRQHGHHQQQQSRSRKAATNIIIRLHATDPTQQQLASLIESRISRLSTLQALLQKHGAPGSQGCCVGDDDLVPISGPITAIIETPELIVSMSKDAAIQSADTSSTTSSSSSPVDSESTSEKFKNLHPYLFPICQSTTTGNVICAYRDPSNERELTATTILSDTNTNGNVRPWPIVETKIGAPGVNLIALNSEHLLRRIVCELDDTGKHPQLIALYNEGLGQGRLKDTALDVPYVPGSVKKLGYGVDKYVLLRVGPFADLYEKMAREHYNRGDESSALIAAETANGKLSGFASTFRFYARLLSSFPHRTEEVRDAARMCLRMSLPTIGMNMADYEEVATLGNMSTEFDTPEVALQKLGEMYKLIQNVEKDDDKVVKNPVELALDEASNLINDTVLQQKEWSSIRPRLAQIFRKIGRDEMALFVDF